jgi:hypothetical protein
MCADALEKSENDTFNSFVWANPDFSLTSAKEKHARKRASGRKKIGVRTPVMEMAHRYTELVRTLGSGGKKNQGRHILDLHHLTLKNNQWVTGAPAFRSLMKELAHHLILHRWKELDPDVVQVSIRELHTAHVVVDGI